jgi:membrane fusion protein, multidrug efflux system
MLRATGTTQAIKQAELGPKSSGVLAAVLVEEGMRVKKGQVLFRIDATNAYLATRQAEAGLAQARVGLSQAELDFNRTKPLADQGTISPATWDQVRLGYERAKVAVQQAEAAVASSRAYASDATVVAPFAGVVSAKRKNAGETVTMMPATTVVILQDTSQIEVRVKLAESALMRIRAGDTMQVKWPSLNLVKDVQVTRINPGIDPLNRTVELVSVVPNPDGDIKAGMLVDVTFPSTAPSTPTTAPAIAAATPNSPLPSPRPSSSAAPKLP